MTAATNHTNSNPVATNATVAASPQKMDTSEVGFMFVHEYYTFLNKEPNRLHCFYNKKSTLTHGTEGESIKTCHGQQV